MKYGESTFDILYLVFAILTGIVILLRRRNKADVLMGTAALVLGAGDAFHLVPRVLNYFSSRDMTWYLGFGKLVTSITMTVFYILVFYLYKTVYRKEERIGVPARSEGAGSGDPVRAGSAGSGDPVRAGSSGSVKAFGGTILLLAAVRVALCLLPGNNWFSGEGTVLWGIIRNVPFIVIGALIVYLYYGVRKEDRYLLRFWIYTALSFLFYIPVAVFAPLLPILGMLMIPKTICYILMLVSFLRRSRGGETEEAKA